MKNIRNRIFLLTCALAAGGLIPLCGCSHQNQYESSRDAKQRFIEMIETAGGSAKLERIREFDELLEGESWFIDLSGAEISKGLVQALLEQADVQPGTIASINLSKSTITNEQVLELCNSMICNYTLFLDLSDTGLDDATLVKIENLYFLQTLNLKGTKVTGAAVKTFKDNRRGNKGIEPAFKNPKIQL